MSTTAPSPGARAPAGDDRTAAALAAERDFLLRSLADLDAEHAAGELSDDRYGELHDRYTVQAATVLRALERHERHERQGTATPGADPRRRARRRVAAGVLVAAILAGGGALLVAAARDRQPGQTITGNAQLATADLEALARTARQRPDDAGAQLEYGSALLEARRFVDALRAFDTAARLDPTNPMPKAYGGWIVFIAGLTNEALTRLDAAVSADPSYPDARFFRGMVLLRGRRDETAALADLREYLRLAPDGPERAQVQELVDQVVASTASVPSSP